jgi:Ca2+-binding RTX toxin-like protein
MPSRHTRARTRQGAAAVALGIVATALLPASPARAASATVALQAGKIVFRAAAGQVNNLTVSRLGTTGYMFADIVPVTPGAGCAAVGVTAVACIAAANVILDIDIDTGDLDDTVTKTSGNTSVIAGGAGNDVLNGGPSGTDVDLSTSNDLRGGDGNDILTGGTGTDVLDGGPGADKMLGGAGSDLVTYASRTLPVTADLDGVADDGETGEGDLIGTDVENLTGGSGNDVLIGNGANNMFNGGPGNDTLTGLAGSDSLTGGLGNDALSGGDGDDYLLVEGGTNTADGGAGNDTIYLRSMWADQGPDGTSTATGGPGNDLIFSGTGLDKMSGGTGIDEVSYSFRATPVTADLDGDTGDDGSPGEHDTIAADVENLTGGDADDVLIGNDGPNVISADLGDDVVKGLGGNDTLYGESGDDVLLGGVGDDLLWGGPGAGDFLNCGAGTDSYNVGANGGSQINCEVLKPEAGLRTAPTRTAAARAAITR